jgi:hypothetical protein
MQCRPRRWAWIASYGRRPGRRFGPRAEVGHGDFATRAIQPVATALLADVVPAARLVPHLAAGGACHAQTLLADVNDRIRILRVHDFTTDDRIGATITEHLEVLACVLARDPDAAAAFMRAHVQRSALVVRERVGSALARMFELPA